MRISIVAHVNSKREKIEKDLFGTLHVYVSAPPLEGKANSAIARSLATYFKVKNSQVMLISGAKSKNKVYEIIQLTNNGNRKMMEDVNLP